jgi:ubiquinone/menaquinone biosynthesis C-methylase UbiE
MKKYDPRKTDFEKPSVMFVIEDTLKGLFGNRLYNSYFQSQGGFEGNERVLDFGCGSGVSTKLIARQLTQGGMVTGLDTSSYFIKKAQKRLKRYTTAQTLQGDIQEIKIPESSFDLISIIHVIHDIVEEKRQSMVKALARVLKPEGKLWILEPIKESHGIPVDEIRGLMGNAGLRELKATIKKSSYRGIYQK